MLLRKTTTLRIIYVALFSLFFYYESSGEYVLILLFAATMDYFIGRAMGQSEDPRYRKRPSDHECLREPRDALILQVLLFPP